VVEDAASLRFRGQAVLAAAEASGGGREGEVIIGGCPPSELARRF